jgi:ABC-2 type transport system ATP-binding protein
MEVNSRPSAAAIQLEGLTRTYGDVHALRGIDLRIERGGLIVGLLGPNGAGSVACPRLVRGTSTLDVAGALPAEEAHRVTGA